MFNRVLSNLVRWYLRNAPITEGKKQLLAITKSLIIPEEPNQFGRMKYGFTMKLNLKNAEHLRMWLYGEHDERYEIRILRKIIQAGDVCLDIGANIGFYTCYFALLVGRKGRVVAFEPADQTFKLLSENINLNGFSNVEPIKAGIGDCEGEGLLSYNESSFCEGTASIKFKEGKPSQERVQLSSIDDLFNRGMIGNPAFVKIDVEGFQKEVLIGGKNFFRDGSPIMMAELKEHNKDDEEAKSVEDLIRNYGFSIYEIHKHGLKECRDTVKSGKRNFILVKRPSHHFQRLAGLIP